MGKEEITLDESWYNEGYENSYPALPEAYISGASDFQRRAIEELECIKINTSTLNNYPIKEALELRNEVINQAIEIIKNLKV